MARVTVSGKGKLPVDPLENSGHTFRALYEYILRMAQKDGGVKEERQGVPGYLWEGSMRGVINDLYPGRDDLDTLVKRLGNHRMRTANLAVAVRGNYGKGQKQETLWWVRHEWSSETVALPQRKWMRKQVETSIDSGNKPALPVRRPVIPAETVSRERFAESELKAEKLKQSVRELANENAELRDRILVLEKLTLTNVRLRSIVERFVTVADTTTLLDIIMGEYPDE